jgi:hypothetical protein
MDMGIDPDGLRTGMEKIYQRYQLPMIVTENGMAVSEKPDENGEINDTYRIDYIKAHLEQIHKMLEEPNGMIAKTLGSRLSTSLIEAAVKEQMGRDQARQRENKLERNAQPQMNPIHQA